MKITDIIAGRLRARFFAKVDASGGPDACHVWTASRYPSGYGQFGFDGSTIGAHRMAWMIEYGEIPAGMLVLHRCDNRPCCNIRHLFIGTQQDNIDDMMAKGRGNHGGPNAARGERQAFSKITEVMAAEIREMYATTSITQAALAAQFGIGQSAVSAIIRGGTWAHVGGERGDGDQKRSGSGNHMARLTEAAVLEIRALHSTGNLTQQAIADQFGVSVQTVNLIVLRKTWRHVP